MHKDTEKKSAFPLGTKNTTTGHVGGLGHPDRTVNTKPAMSEITPRTAQANKGRTNYSKTPYQKNGCC